MKLKFFILSTLALALSITLMSCTNTSKKSQTIIGELIANSPITKDFSKFSGTESYKFKISKETIFSYNLKLRNGKITITLTDENGNEYLNVNKPTNNTITLNPNKETTYYVNLTYDNGVGTYTFSIEN